MREAPQGYPTFKRMGMNEQQIKDYLEREAENFKAVNQIMINNGRPPLFPDPCDTYKSSVQYFELIYRYHASGKEKISKCLNHGKESEEKLAEIMGVPGRIMCLESMNTKLLKRSKHIAYSA